MGLERNTAGQNTVPYVGPGEMKEMSSPVEEKAIDRVRDGEAAGTARGLQDEAGLPPRAQAKGSGDPGHPGPDHDRRHGIACRSWARPATFRIAAQYASMMG